MLYDEIGDKDSFEKSSVKLKSKEASLKNYVDKNSSLSRRKDREQVVGFDKGVSTRTVEVNRSINSAVKSFAKSGTADIIKIDAEH